MVVVIPMAGRGSRVAGLAGELPKPLIPVRGRPMVEWAFRSLEGVDYRLAVFVALREHEERFGVSAIVQSLAGPKSRLVVLDGVTEGQLCTVLEARAFLRSDEGLLVASADTWVRSSIGRDITERAPECAGLISVAQLPGERWSFARLGKDGSVAEVAEKVRISDLASTGLYYFSGAGEFLAAGEALVAAGERERGEYFVIPVYRRLLAAGRRVGVSIASAAWDLGSPEGIAAFEKGSSEEGMA